MTLGVRIQPELYRWAMDRSGKSVSELSKPFPKLPEWLEGRGHPTMEEAKAFAQANWVQVGLLMNDEPVLERLPIPDYRTNVPKEFEPPRGDLLDAVYVCVERQAHYRQFALGQKYDEIPFAGGADLRTNPDLVAQRINSYLGLDPWARQSGQENWARDLERLRAKAEDVLIMVMRSDRVMGEADRLLDPRGFRGFAFADNRASLLFLNSADSASAQVFMLAYALAQIHLGETGVLDPSLPANKEGQEIGDWCKAVAIAMLVPAKGPPKDSEATPTSPEPLTQEAERLAALFRIDSQPILERLSAPAPPSQAPHDISDSPMSALIRAKASSSRFAPIIDRIGVVFTLALIRSALAGKLTADDAAKLMEMDSEKDPMALAQILSVDS